MADPSDLWGLRQPPMVFCCHVDACSDVRLSFLQPLNPAVISHRLRLSTCHSSTSFLSLVVTCGGLLLRTPSSHLVPRCSSVVCWSLMSILRSRSSTSVCPFVPLFASLSALVFLIHVHLSFILHSRCPFIRHTSACGVATPPKRSFAMDYFAGSMESLEMEQFGGLFTCKWSSSPEILKTQLALKNHETSYKL